MNLENMNILIDAINAAPAAKCIMGSWVDRHSDGECGSAYCIAGWVDHLVDEKMIPGIPYETSLMDESTYAAQMRAVMDMTAEDVERLALMKGYMYSNRLEAFDHLPPIIRKEAMLNVLRKYRDTGDIDWGHAISVAKISCGYDGDTPSVGG